MVLAGRTVAVHGTPLDDEASGKQNHGIDTNTLNSFHLHTIFNFDVVSSTTNTTREIYLMADFLPPSGPPPPKVPEGWKAVWDEQYKEW